MTIALPKPATKARFLMIGYGLVLLIWMSLEHRSVLTVSLLGAGATILYGGVWVMHHLHQYTLSLKFWFIGLIIIGAGMGVLSAISTAMLMFFKSSWHAHLYPDYPPQLIIDLLTRMPIWSLSGALIGFCCAIFILTQQSKSDSQL